MSTDVLGRVVEVTSGLTLADFFRERIFEPLGMHDTAFHVAARSLGDFTAVYAPSDAGLVEADSPYDGPFTRPPSWYSGGGGLTSTPLDYLRFSQMLLDGGELDGVRILQEETVREMTRNQLDASLWQRASGGPGYGFGLGFAVAVDGPVEGRYWWSGVANTFFSIDPVERLITFAWTQNAAYGSVPIDPMLREIVYEAIVESNRVAAPAGA